MLVSCITDDFLMECLSQIDPATIYQHCTGSDFLSAWLKLGSLTSSGSADMGHGFSWLEWCGLGSVHSTAAVLYAANVRMFALEGRVVI
mmetsp:Transcript_15836/g.34158  ORF Transcript_15836/g.34158 Transcript_15836/m.34158 type:complete len:89 (-) Transcript_15836:136-402(-)